MIIFNLASIPVGIVVGIVWGVLVWMLPSLGEDGLDFVSLGLVMLVVGGAAEAFDIKGRLFWLPMWLVGLGLSVVGVYDLLGWVGLLAGAALLAAAVVGLVLLGRKTSARELTEAPARLAEAQQAIAGGEVALFWERMGGAYRPPAFGAIKAERARQLEEALAVLEAQAGALMLSEDAVSVLRAARIVARSIAEGAPSPGFSSKERSFMGEIETLIEKQGAWDPPEHVLTDLREWESKSLAA